MKTMRAAEVARSLGVSIQTVWRWRSQDNGFPQPAKLGPKTIVWDEVDIQAWVNSKKPQPETPHETE